MTKYIVSNKNSNLSQKFPSPRDSLCCWTQFVKQYNLPGERVLVVIRTTEWLLNTCPEI